MQKQVNTATNNAEVVGWNSALEFLSKRRSPVRCAFKSLKSQLSIIGPMSVLFSSPKRVTHDRHLPKHDAATPGIACIPNLS